MAFDAVDYSNNIFKQYEAENINRAIIKATHAFSAINGTDINVPVATGRWGSGSFKGDAVLNAMIQIAAASYVKRPLIFLKMTDPTTVSINDIINMVIEKNYTAANLAKIIVNATRTSAYTRNQTENETITTISILKELGSTENNISDVQEHLDKAAADYDRESIKTLSLAYREEATGESQREEDGGERGEGEGGEGENEPLPPPPRKKPKKRKVARAWDPHQRPPARMKGRHQLR